MRDIRMVDTRAETATIGLVAGCLLVAAAAGAVHVGSRLEHEWIRLPDHAPAGHRHAGEWLVLAPMGERFQVSLPSAPGSWVDPEGAANPAARVAGSLRRGYRLIDVAPDGLSLIHISEPPLPEPMLESLIAAAVAPASRIVGRRPLTAAECSGYEIVDVQRDPRRGDIYTRRQWFWSGPCIYAFAFSSPNRSDLSGFDASRFFGSITITR